MENEEAAALDSSWLGEEPLETESVFANDGVGEIPFGPIGDVEDRELMFSSTYDRVCSEYKNHVFPMYEVVFIDMGFRLPFSEFQREMLCWTKMSPLQIHPNSYAFMRAFELLCVYLCLPASKNVFFSFFTVQSGTDWVSFRQTQKMFEVFAGKVRSFKERFFLVRLRSAAALDTLFKVAKDGVQERHPFFPLSWSQNHFRFESKDFGQTVTNLSDEEIDIRQQLWAFFQSLPRRTKIDKRANPLMSADGTLVTEPRLINTHELLTSENFEDCLEKMKDLGALVSAGSKKISAKKRRKNVQSLEHLIAGIGVGSSFGPVVDLEGEDPPEELVQKPAKKEKLPRVWSEPDQCGPYSTLFLDDSELRIIQDLGPPGRSKAIADGAIATMKALEVAAALNNVSLENEIRVNALAQERDALTAKVAAIEEDERSKRSVVEERDRQFTAMEGQLAEARTALEEALALLISWLRIRRLWRKL
ncbi:hypothetical protein MTR_0034s0130 [Medicago truncatula]|uniref:Transposase (putative) gypsy type domain-containing protein n=1 Tax=Medicago truncatula TaxID=3880 RepID=A0A072TJY4_MEDTR|nr:hypothetical protein MTR_0034s0130 [Medicago truncatula]